MGPKPLRVSPALALPPDAITQSIALLAVRRAGKSNAAAVLAEEMHHAGLPWVVIDPKGDWWGLRSSADGTGPGLHIPIFGGLHGDLPLVPEAGHLIAELIVDQNLTCVLDVSEFASKAAQTRFLADLGERLFRLHGRHPQPRMVFLEEADDVIPQRVMHDMARCVGAWTKVVKQGGSRGLGITIISQRSAVVNKDALTQCETLIALRTTSPQDRKAILDWVNYHAVAKELVDSLPGLDDGEAWVCSPHWLGRHGMEPMQRVRFSQRATYDSGATPGMKQARRPATLADIDLSALMGQMESVAEKAAHDDPKALRRRIAELERRVAAAGQAEETAAIRDLRKENAELRGQLAEAAARPPERVEVPVVAAADLAHLNTTMADVLAGWTTLREALDRVSHAQPQTIQPPVPARAPIAPIQLGGALMAPPIGQLRPRTAVPPPQEEASAGDPGSLQLGKAHRAILTVLAQFPGGRDKRQLAMLTGYSARGGGFNNALGALRTAGYISKGEPVMATAEGLAVLGSDWEPLPAGAALLEHWVAQLGRAEGLILRELVNVWPQSLSKADVAESTGYTETGGGFNNALGRLRTLQLIEGRGELRADDTLAQEARSG